MTMDFDPPRVERPASGGLWMLIGIPIGVVGYFIASWSPALEVAFMVFLGLVLVLLYRRGARARIIRTGRGPLYVVGAIVVVAAVIGGSAVGFYRMSVYQGPIDAVVLAGLAARFTGEALLGAVLGIGAGVGSLVYFTQRFSRPQPA